MVSNGEAGSPPVRVGAPMVDYGTGAQAAYAIAAALYQRERTGLGQRIDVSMADAALMLQSVMVSATQATGQSPSSHGNAHPKYAGYATYETADGLLMVGAWTNRQMSDLYRLLGDEARAKRTEATARKNLTSLREDDTAFLKRELVRKTADQWEGILNQGGVPASRVRTLAETMASQQIAARQVLQPYEGCDRPEAPNALPVAGFTFEHDGPSLSAPPPRLGQHTNEILAEMGYSAHEITGFRDERIVG
jgi:crotonobetainyl-CoA:carnitine CoA-transferase CaiB-like acyl-CoA transferase